MLLDQLVRAEADAPDRAAVTEGYESGTLHIVRSEDEDDAEGGSGPPPDPTLRQWRHPSEIAAASAAAARPEQPAPLRRHGPIVKALAAAAAASLVVSFGALIVAVVLDAGGPDGSFAFESSKLTPRSETGASLLTSAQITVESASSTTSTTSLRTTVTSAPSTTLARRATTTESPPTTGPPATPLGDSTDGVVGEEIAAAEVGPQGNGLFSDPSVLARRLAAFLLVDETIFTSASAIDGFDEVALLTDGQWATATVVARDIGNDLAILDVEDAAAKARLVANPQLAWTAPDEPGPATTGSPIILVVDGQESVFGFIVDADHRVVATTGNSVYGALLTSAPMPDGAGGAALTNDASRLIGLVVNSAGQTASILPVETMVAMGRSVREWGVPAIEWLGIKGSSLPKGGVRLNEVMVDGPAFLAKLLPDDIISSVNGEMVQGWDHLVHLIRRLGAGSTIEVVIERNSISRKISATIGAKSDYPTSAELETTAAQ